jgi:hypothetical protein
MHLYQAPKRPDHNKIEHVIESLQISINNWVATVLPGLTKHFTEEELAILAKRIKQEM